MTTTELLAIADMFDVEIIDVVTEVEPWMVYIAIERSGNIRAFSQAIHLSTPLGCVYEVQVRNIAAR